MKSNAYFKLQGGGYDLSLTFEGTGSGNAWLQGNKVYVDLTSAQAGKYVLISDEIFDGCRVVDAYFVQTAANSTSTITLQKFDGTTETAISDTVSMTGDKDLVPVGELDDAAWELGIKSDGVECLQLEVATAAFSGMYVIELASAK